MKQSALVFSGLIAIVALGAGACATAPKSTSLEKSRVVTLTATVEAIDQASRVVTLKGPQGTTLTFKVAAGVRNLSQVSVGDQVAVQYRESLVLRVLAPGEASINQGASSVGRSGSGEEPAGTGAQEITITVSIEAVNKDRGTVSYKGPDGYLTTIRAADPANLEKIKAGDRVAITYTEALAVDVEKIGK